MTFTQLLDNQRFRPVLIALAAFAALFLVFNVLVIGGNEIYQFVNNIIPVVVAGWTSFQLYRIWQGHAQDQSARRVWNYLLVGILLWTVGDLVWAFYALVLQIDVPYPSWADAVWVAGYFLLFVGLYAQFRTYNIRPTMITWLIIAGFALILVLAAGYFVLLPILQSFDPDRLLESFLNVFYPLLDLVLLPLCFLILGTLGDGRLAISWKIITVGFILRAVSDLIFARITWDGSYMPDGQINLISSLYDFIYVMSYLTTALGFVAYRVLIAQSTVVEASPAAPEAPSGNAILVSTDAYNYVISFSENFLALLNRADAKGIKGAPLYQLLGMDEADIRAVETGLAQQGMIDALPLDVKHKNGAATQVRLSALAVYYEGNSYKGANIVINTLAPLGVQDNLSVESQGMMRAILARTGNPQRETRAALITYFNTQMRMLDDLVHQYGGKTISQTMRMVINDTATKNGWQVRKDGADFVILDQEGDIDTLAGTMSVLLAAARGYARDMVGAQLVKTEVENINILMNPAVMNQVDHYGLRLSGDTT